MSECFELNRSLYKKTLPFGSVGLVILSSSGVSFNIREKHFIVNICTVQANHMEMKMPPKGQIG